MRKSDREVTEPAEKLAVLLRCDFMTLALAEEEAPYALPLNFGAEVRGGVLYLYFHCAREGKKLDLLRAAPKVGFSAAHLLRIFNKGVAPCGYTTDYESICGWGVARILQTDAEREHALRVLMAHYTGETFARVPFHPHSLSLTETVEICVQEWTCKRLVRP